METRSECEIREGERFIILHINNSTHKMVKSPKINSSKTEFSDLNRKKENHVRPFYSNENRNKLGHRGHQRTTILQI